MRPAQQGNEKGPAMCRASVASIDMSAAIQPQTLPAPPNPYRIEDPVQIEAQGDGQSCHGHHVATDALCRMMEAVICSVQLGERRLKTL